jgi:hypothetical protein
VLDWARLAGEVMESVFIYTQKNMTAEMFNWTPPIFASRESNRYGAECQAFGFFKDFEDAGIVYDNEIPIPIILFP